MCASPRNTEPNNASLRTPNALISGSDASSLRNASSRVKTLSFIVQIYDVPSNSQMIPAELGAQSPARETSQRVGIGSMRGGYTVLPVLSRTRILDLPNSASRQ